MEAAYREIPEPARFRSALEELGGLYAAFGQFLRWRADVLRTDYLGRLRHIELAVSPIPVTEVSRILLSELGPNGGVMAHSLETEPCWNTLARCAYRAQYQGKAVVVHDRTGELR